MSLEQIQIKRVLVSDPIDPSCPAILRKAGMEVVEKSKLKEDELCELIKDFDSIIVRSGTQVTKKVIEAGTNLKIIGRAGTGVDNIDCTAATHNGVIVMNTPGGNTLSAAEHTCAMLCSMSRNIPQAVASMKDGKWNRKAFMGHELNGKVLAILGLGRIGKEVALRMQAFGMTTVGYDPILPKEVAKGFGVTSYSLEELWPMADYITVHTPLIAETRGLVNAATLAKCKKGVCIINCARGGIVDEKDLLLALESGQCGGAALDVYEEEPPSDLATNQLLKHPKVVCTPHLGASTEEAQAKVAQEIASQIVAAAKGEAVGGSINARALTQALKPEIHPWVQLGSKLGSLVAQFAGSSAFSASGGRQNMLRLKVRVQGKLILSSSTTLASAVLSGLLNHLQSTPVNLINAFPIAEEMGMNVTEEKVVGTHQLYQNVLTVVVQDEGGNDSNDHTYAGTVFGNGQVRLTECDGYSFEVKPTGNLIFYRNLDRPGVLAEISKALYESNLNISDFNMGRHFRKSDGSMSEQVMESLTIINVDEPVTNEIVTKLRGVKYVLDACRADL